MGEDNRSMISLLNSIGFLVFGLTITGCSHLFYFPDSYLYRHPADFTGEYFEAKIESSPEALLTAWLFPAKTKPVRGVVIQFHGNGQNMSAHGIFATWLVEHGYHVVTFDYRCYGASTGTPSQEGTIKDGDAIMRYVNNHPDLSYLPKIVLGQSLGGAIALTTLAHYNHKVDVLVLDSSFGSYQEVARSVLANHWPTWPFQWLSYLLVEEFQEPLVEAKGYKGIGSYLVVFSEHDPVVPYSNSQEIIHTLGQGDLVVWSTGGDHHIGAFAPSSPYRTELVRFLCDRLSFSGCG